jgi:glutamine synthetase type III
MNHSETDYRKTPLTEIYGIHVFNESVMRQRLPKPVYNQLKDVQRGKRELSLEVAEVVEISGSSEEGEEEEAAFSAASVSRKASRNSKSA